MSRKKHFGAEMRLRALGRMLVLFGLLLALNELEYVYRIKDSRLISWYAAGYPNGSPGWSLLLYKREFWFGLACLFSGFGLARLSFWGYVPTVALTMLTMKVGLLNPPRTTGFLLVGVMVLLVLLLPGNFVVLRSRRREVILNSPEVKYRAKAWCGAVVSLVLLTVFVWNYPEIETWLLLYNVEPLEP